MGYLMENGKIHWGYIKGKWCKNIIRTGLQLTVSFEKGLKFHKAGVPFGCICCNKQKPKGTRYLSHSWNKVCSDCAMVWIKESVKTFNNAIGMLNERKVELSDEKKIKKWRKEMILGALEGEKNV